MEGGSQAKRVTGGVGREPGFWFHPWRNRRELGAHGPVAAAQAAVAGEVFESRPRRHLATCLSLGAEDGRASAVCQGSSAFGELAFVYRGLRFTPDLSRLLSGRKAPVVDTEEALKMWAGTRRLQSSYPPPPPLRSRYLNGHPSEP